ncbi:DUF397 domain-containing protein [Streptomyces inhibens]|uniref:DUF397 domain-containing protein n=1 Tax=Streptomyces inhibens TaxID=2293571 RepID=A0A371PQU3_STRIH|nr:DUF397 domain-containing protein [Streptomyces inhibens]REK84581.1 DUF397 domain-containing protein [Streptomyces inhibens]
MKIGPTQWIKSSYSSAEGGNCLEWAPTYVKAAGVVPVRDSKEPHGPTLGFSTAAWTSFVGGVQRGDFPKA